MRVLLETAGLVGSSLCRGEPVQRHEVAQGVDEEVRQGRIDADEVHPRDEHVGDFDPAEMGARVRPLACSERSKRECSGRGPAAVDRGGRNSEPESDGEADARHDDDDAQELQIETACQRQATRSAYHRPTGPQR